MALGHKSLFLYGYQVSPLNSSLDFRATLAGPILKATLRLGYYSLSALMREISRAMQAIDPDNEYTVTADRTVAGGLQNRVTIATNGTYLDLLFLTGPRTATNCASLIGFVPLDFTGALTYTGSVTSGTTLAPTLVGYNYLSPDFNHKVFGAVNISASGQKEAVVFQIQRFTQIQFKHEPKLKVVNEWLPFANWAIQQRLFDFTPDITDPSTFYEVTLEKNGSDGKGLAQMFKEQLPDFPNYYDVGLWTMRVNEV